MTSSHIDFIRPEKLNDARIFSWFSLKNSHLKEKNQQIPGLNVGFNSNERQDILLHNLSLLSSELRMKPSNLALAEQVHKTNIKVITKGGIYPETDAFVSKTPGTALGIQVADCGAILFGDATNKVVGAAHAGWRGAVDGIVLKTIGKMLELGAELNHIKVFVSPCIAKHNFEVGDEVAEKFADHLVDREHYTKPHVDLKGLVKEQLLESGIDENHIEIDERCTIDHEELFYSYRREKEKSGRMVGIIKLNKLK
ncbi:MAG: peptidoglycan editing factor PgeF [Balneolaceae bacterium]|nr:peptidoglycan editing factor PgeF [Balneolaceae bacterium]MBO6547467.1 peptidoglycan editing factor PgeF [Balneolaceae bacterium]MBO6647586.1 peptidoglycan editing factor PgeF [Balneolaceae bacterium]